MQKLKHRSLSLALLALVAALAVACGGSDEEDDPTQTPTAEPTETATSEPTEEPTSTPEPYAGDVATIEIPRFDVESAIEDVGVTDGQMDTPEDPNNTGFYDPDLTGWGGNEFLPGWEGNAILSAHVDYWPDIVGPFNRLADMQSGDEVHIVMDDGTEYVYEVMDEPERYHVSEFPTGELIDAPDRPEGEEWITLITCGGDLDAPEGEAGSYTHRDVVIAERVS